MARDGSPWWRAAKNPAEGRTVASRDEFHTPLGGDDDLHSLDFETPEQMLRYFQEISDDLERAVIPQMPTVRLTRLGPNGEVLASVPKAVGMILHRASETIFLTREYAEKVLNDGILNRMRIPISLVAPPDRSP
jgi:hypothetical protein